MTSRLHASHDIASAFTPGPWKVYYATNGKMLGVGVDRPNDEDDAAGVTDAYGGLWGSGGEKEANAHLIAAAPELYEALSKCASMIRHAVGADVFIDPAHTMRLADVAALLAKARGEQVQP